MPGYRNHNSVAHGGLKDRPALKGHAPTAAVPFDLGYCATGSRLGGFFPNKASPGERHDDTVWTFADHTRQFEANPMLGRNSNRLTVDKLAQYLDFEVTKLELHRSPARH